VLEVVTLSQRVSISVGYFTTGTAFEDLKIHKRYVSAGFIGIIVLETCFLIGMQTAAE
jgi:hypothetical protein